MANLRIGEWIVLIGALLIIGLASAVGRIIYLKPPLVEFMNAETPLGKQGEMVFRRESCFSCHEVFGNGASYGPSLDGVGSKRTEPWLRDYMVTPRAGVSAKPYRLKMPSYGRLKEAEMDAVVAYLAGLRSVDKDGRAIDPPAN